jgi:aryl-alcohol dehydrogenase-like predicted oxidoreductase
MENNVGTVFEQITLGRTGIKISPMGIGTWQWGDRFFWGYGQGGYNDEDLHSTFQENLAAGINFFDTAEIYGNGRSETLLGRYLGESGQTLVIASKFMPYPWRLRRSSLARSLRMSLSRLGLKAVDLYQIHWPTPPYPVEVWVNALAEVYQEGLVRAVGVSNYSTSQMVRAYEILEKRGIPLASNQVRYSLIDRKPEDNGLMNACKNLGITLIAYSPLAQGLLTGKYTSKNPVSGVRRFQFASKVEAIQPLIGLMKEIGQAHEKKSPSQIALNWVMAMGGVPIPGAKNVRQARENIGALGWALTENEIEALNQASQKI